MVTFANILNEGNSSLYIYLKYHSKVTQKDLSLSSDIEVMAFWSKGPFNTRGQNNVRDVQRNCDTA